MSKVPAWLELRRGKSPLVLSIPHTGLDLAGLEPRLVSPWLARKDADWWIGELYAFAAELDATILRTTVSRTMIDVNRDPSGASLYPGQATTGLCPLTTFDGEPLYKPGQEPDEMEVAERRALFFDPYHAALAAEIERLSADHQRVVLYDCHSIRSRIPRLFEGDLPIFNLGTHEGASASPELIAEVESSLAGSGRPHVTDGRFKGGWITRHYGRPAEDVHALQMELACRGYMREHPGAVSEADWPVPYDSAFARHVQQTLRQVLEICIRFGEGM